MADVTHKLQVTVRRDIHLSRLHQGSSNLSDYAGGLILTAAKPVCATPPIGRRALCVEYLSRTGLLAVLSSKFCPPARAGCVSPLIS